MFQNQKVLVTGGTGLIGRHVVELLIQKGAKVRIASLDQPHLAHPKAEFRRVNLTKFEHCLEVCEGMDYVFHVAGIKGSPHVTLNQPASFFVPTVSFNLNMMEAARQSNVKWFLLTSTVGVYAPAEVFHEDDVWKTFPSHNDRFAGWAKRMGELQAEAYRIEYGFDQISIVRPANVYGPYDDFEPPHAMVVPSLIKRALDGENPFVIWGDGTAIRDFIHAQDVARGMITVVEKKVQEPVNLGSGVGYTIRSLVEIIVSHMKEKPKIVWDTQKPTGDKKRLMDVSRASSIGFKPSISLEQGVKEVMAWYEKNHASINGRYNVFSEKKVLGQ